MQKAKKNMRKINLKKAVATKFREYDQKLEALTNFNVSEAFKIAIQVKVLTEIKKLLPTHIPNAIENYVKPRLNTSMLKVVKTNQINLFPQSSTSTDDLSEMDLKLKLLNQIHLNKSNDTRTTHQQLYDTLYESIILDQDALDAQAAQSSFYKSQLKAAVLLEAQWKSDEGDISKPRSFERHISKSTKPHLCFYNNDYTYIVDLSTEERYTTSITKHYATRYYKEGIEDRIPKRWSKEVCRYHFEALNGIHHWEEDRIDFFKVGMSVVTEGNVYSDLRIKSIVRIVVKKKWGYGFLTSIIVRRSDDKEYEFSYADLPRLNVNDIEDMYLLQVQDKLHHLPLEFVKDFNNALLMFIRRTVIKNRLGSDNKRLKGRDWTDYDVKSSREMLKNIDEVLRHKEQIRSLEEYVGGRPKTVNPRNFVRPL
ncbi:hypothetical protein Tco_0841316 [Tanacetum coccineum]|uniref:Uncharacterized protein n=1 Tax=Tanacetum coccineum TaxID=301880 RepID=A0ABQ5B0E9_9ASTR